MGLFKGIKKRVNRVGKFVKKNMKTVVKVGAGFVPGGNILTGMMDSEDRMPKAGKAPNKSVNLMDNYQPSDQKRKRGKNTGKALGGVALAVGLGTMFF